MAKKAVVIYGPPGSGKGTQANLLAWTKNFIHFDTGKFLEQVVNDPDNRNNPMIQEEKKLFDGGKLLTPSFVLKVTREKTIDVSKAGFSIVFSGSPRTMFEAFGDDKNRGLVDILDEQYGKENALFVLLDIDPKVAIIQVGKNSFGHPHKEVLEMLGSKGVKIYRNDINGVIELKSDGDNYKVKSSN